MPKLNIMSKGLGDEFVSFSGLFYFILKVDETPTSIGGELSNSSWWAFQSPSKIKPPADGRDARMNFVVQSTTRISPKSAGADLKQKVCVEKEWG